MNCLKLFGQSVLARYFDRQIAKIHIRAADINWPAASFVDNLFFAREAPIRLYAKEVGPDVAYVVFAWPTRSTRGKRILQLAV